VKNSLYFPLKAGNALLLIAILYIASNISIGSTEYWEEVMKNHIWNFYISRLILNFVIGLIFLLISGLIDLLYQHRQRRVFEVIIVAFLSFLFVAFSGLV
jgi:cell division protein FtsW (lipid II flippase)